MKLFVYDHCPYCVRARMIFGLKNIPIELVILANDDEQTPITMVGKKMVPILQKDDGSYMVESLDIVNYIDHHFGEKPILSGDKSDKITAIIEEIESVDRMLLYPRFTELGLPEFKTLSAKNYFINKKQAKAGLFAEYLVNTESSVHKMEAILAKLEPILLSRSTSLSINDICLFPVLRNLTCVKSLSFPTHVAAYVDSMAKQSKINLYYQQAI